MERTWAPPRLAHGARGRGGNRRRNDDTRSRASRVHHPRNRRESASARARVRAAHAQRTPRADAAMVTAGSRAPDCKRYCPPQRAHIGHTARSARRAVAAPRRASQSCPSRGRPSRARARGGGHARGARSLRAPRTKPSSSSMSSSWYSVRLTWGTCARGVRRGGRRVRGGRGGSAARAREGWAGGETTVAGAGAIDIERSPSSA